MAMTTITFRVDEVTRAKLEQLAEAQGVSLSDLVRSTVEELLVPSSSDRSGDDVAPASMSPVERHQTALLHRILAHVMPEDHGDVPTQDCAKVEGDPAYQRARAQVLENGYSSEYPEVFVSIYPEMSAADCRFVLDVLDVFRQATWAVQALERKGVEVDDEVRHAMTFDGFDFNDEREARLAGYAEHLVSPSRWAELQQFFTREAGGGNSHSLRADEYARMVAEYKAIVASRSVLAGADRYRLDERDLRRLMTARRSYRS